MGKPSKKVSAAATPAPAAAPAPAKQDKKSKKAKKEPTPPPPPSESDEEDSEEDSEEEESKADQVKAPAAKKTADESDDEDSDEESAADEDDEDTNDDDEEESDEEEEEGKAAPAPRDKKRKASPDAAAAAAPAEKKAKPAHVKPLKTPTELSSNPASKTLWIGNLSWNVDGDFLSGEFDSFGKIAGVRIQMDRETGRSRGIGYVEFEDVASAEKAFAAGSGGGMVIDGREVRVDYATQRDPNPEGRAKAFGDKKNPPAATLWVGNLSFSAGEDTIHESFSEHGQVSSVRMPTDRDTGASKGFAYVEFASVDQAAAALEALNGKDIAGRNVRIDFAPARSEGGDRGGFGGGRGGGRGGDRGGFRGGRGGGGDRGSFGGRGRGSDRGFAGRGGRGGSDRGRGAPRGAPRTGGIASFEGKKKTFE